MRNETEPRQYDAGNWMTSSIVKGLLLYTAGTLVVVGANAGVPVALSVFGMTTVLNFLENFLEEGGLVPISKLLFDAVKKPDAKISDVLREIDNPRYSKEERALALKNIQDFLSHQKETYGQIEQLVKDTTETKRFINAQGKNVEDITKTLGQLSEQMQKNTDSIGEIKSSIQDIAMRLDHHEQAFNQFVNRYETDRVIQAEFAQMNKAVESGLNSKFGVLFQDEGLKNAMGEYWDAVYNRGSSYQEIKNKETAALKEFERVRDVNQKFQTAQQFFDGVQLIGSIAALCGDDKLARKMIGIAQGGSQILMGISLFSANPIGAGLCFANGLQAMQSAFGKPNPSELEVINNLLEHYTKAIISRIDMRMDRIELILKAMMTRIDQQFFILRYEMHEAVKLLSDQLIEAARTILRQQEIDYVKLRNGLDQLIIYAVEITGQLDSIKKFLVGEVRNKAIDNIKDFRRDLPVPVDSIEKAIEKQDNYFKLLSDWLLTRIHSHELAGSKISKLGLDPLIEFEKNLSENPHVSSTSWWINTLIGYLDAVGGSVGNRILVGHDALVNPFLWGEGVMLFDEFLKQNDLIFQIGPYDSQVVSYREPVHQIHQQGVALRDMLIKLRGARKLFETLFGHYEQAIDALVDHVGNSRFLPIYPPLEGKTVRTIQSFFIKTKEAIASWSDLLRECHSKLQFSSATSPFPKDFSKYTQPFLALWDKAQKEADGLEEYVKHFEGCADSMFDELKKIYEFAGEEQQWEQKHLKVYRDVVDNTLLKDIYTKLYTASKDIDKNLNRKSYPSFEEAKRIMPLVTHLKNNNQDNNLIEFSELYKDFDIALYDSIGILENLSFAWFRAIPLIGPILTTVTAIKSWSTTFLERYPNPLEISSCRWFPSEDIKWKRICTDPITVVGQDEIDYHKMIVEHMKDSLDKIEGHNKNLLNFPKSYLEACSYHMKEGGVIQPESDAISSVNGLLNALPELLNKLQKGELCKDTRDEILARYIHPSVVVAHHQALRKAFESKDYSRTAAVAVRHQLPALHLLL